MRAYADQRVVFALLGLVASVAFASVVLGPRSVAGAKTASGTCCSKGTALGNAAGQQTNPAARARTRAQFPDPPGTIDGAKNPELIPDEVAYKMLFLSIMEPENPTEAQKARQEAKLRMIGLSQDDEASFLARLGEFRDRIGEVGARSEEILKAAPNPSRDSAEWQELSDLDQQAGAAVADAVEALHTGLSQEGFAKLQARLLEFKHTIKAFPTPETESDH
jgi:hypothetical protein